MLNMSNDIGMLQKNRFLGLLIMLLICERKVYKKVFARKKLFSLQKIHLTESGKRCKIYKYKYSRTRA